MIYVWKDARRSRADVILEALGNRTVDLVGTYRFRYDPPRKASTGSGQRPVGDYHLYDGDKEIGAWSEGGKARHCFVPGTKLPKKAYKALIAKYRNANGLSGRVLEALQAALDAGETHALLLLEDGTEG